MGWKLEIRDTAAGPRYRILDNDTGKVELPWSGRERAAGMYFRRQLDRLAAELVREFRTFPHQVHVGDMRMQIDQQRSDEFYAWARDKSAEEMLAEFDRIRKELGL